MSPRAGAPFYGDASLANVAGRRALGLCVAVRVAEGGISLRAGAPFYGDASLANVAGRRALGLCIAVRVAEAAK